MARRLKGRRCLCSREAVTLRWNEPVCEHCLRIEEFIAAITLSRAMKLRYEKLRQSESVNKTDEL